MIVYSQIEKEMLVVVNGIEQFHYTSQSQRWERDPPHPGSIMCKAFVKSIQASTSPLLRALCITSPYTTNQEGGSLKQMPYDDLPQANQKWRSC